MAKKNQFAAAHFHDEEAARQWFEAARWSHGPICPKCGSEKYYATKKLGRYRCAAPTCRKDFTVQTGTVMERSHAKLTEWAIAFHMAASSKKGFSAHQLHRELGCQYNTAWFLHHRVMEAMRRGGLEPPMGGEGKIVEVDETYFGELPEAQRRTHSVSGRPYTTSSRRGVGNKRAIIALVERGGSVRSFHVPGAHVDNVTAIVRENIARETRLQTDESHILSPRRQGVCFARNRQSYGKGICARRCNHEHGRGLFLDLQTRYARRVPALQREAFASLSGGVRFPLQLPGLAWVQ